MDDFKRNIIRIDSEPAGRLSPTLSPQKAGEGARTAPMADAQIRQPIILSAPILFSDLTDRIPTEEEVSELASSFNRGTTFRMLCMLNTLISFYATDIRQSLKVQEFLFANLVEDELFEEAKRRFARANMMERPLFHRQQMLALMKRVLLESSEDGEVDPNPNENVRDRYAVGRACLMLNNFLFPKEQENRLRKGGGPDEDERIHGELFAQWLPTSELLNTPDPLHAVVRNLEYVRIFDGRFAEFTFSGGQTLSQRFEALTGIELRRYLGLIFTMYLFYKDQSRSLENLLENPALFNIDTRNFFAKLKLTDGEVAAFFRLTANDIEGLTREFQNPSPTKHPVLPQYEFTPFRRSPLVYVNEERAVVTCVDPAFLSEKISTGAFHTILKSLEVEGGVRTESDEADRKRFLKRYWGEVFQIYVNARIRDAFPPETNRFFDSPMWDSPKARANTEAFDAVLDYGDALVVIEEKGKYLEFSAKYSGRREVLLEDLNERFGKGVRQLAASLEAVFNNDPGERRHTFSERDQNNRPTVQYPPEAARLVRRVYPLLIVQDFSLQIGFANRELRNMFAEEIKNRRLDPALVRPLSLLTVEDLETVLPYLDVVSLTEILDEYTSPHEPLFRFEHILNQFLRRRGIEERHNQWVERCFEELRQSLIDLFAVFD